MLCGCANPEPTSSPSPSVTPAPTQTPEAAPRPSPAFPEDCTSLGNAVDIGAAAGSELPLTVDFAGGAAVTSFETAQELAGGLLNCVWGDIGGPAVGVGIAILPRTSTDRFDAYSSAQSHGCADGTAVMPWVVCAEDFTTNGYWVEVQLHAGEGSTAAVVAPRYDVLLASLSGFVDSAAAPAASTLPTTPLQDPLCTNGPATLAATYGTDAESVFEPGHGSEYDIAVEAIARAGAVYCVWGIGENVSWAFWVLPGGAWAFHEPLSAYLVDRGIAQAADAPSLSPVTIPGADQARTACANGNCEAQLVIGDDLLIAASSEPAAEFTSILEKILRT